MKNNNEIKTDAKHYNGNSLFWFSIDGEAIGQMSISYSNDEFLDTEEETIQDLKERLMEYIQELEKEYGAVLDQSLFDYHFLTVESYVNNYFPE